VTASRGTASRGTERKAKSCGPEELMVVALQKSRCGNVCAIFVLAAHGMARHLRAEVLDLKEVSVAHLFSDRIRHLS
jgi:hypothetical protein